MSVPSLSASLLSLSFGEWEEGEEGASSSSDDGTLGSQRYTIKTVIPGSPADVAGLRPGMRVVRWAFGGVWGEGRDVHKGRQYSVRRKYGKGRGCEGKVKKRCVGVRGIEER